MKFGSNLDIVWHDDPKLLGIRCARYKHVAKMLAGMDAVMEVGAGCGTLSRIVRQSVKRLLLVDLDPQGEEVLCADLTIGPVATELLDAVYSLDVLEHVKEEDEEKFMASICANLKSHGTCIIGMPSQESQVYASPISRLGHVNCKREDQLRSLMQKFFHCVYLFGMQDETLHTGFGGMAHYRLALCNTKR